MKKELVLTRLDGEDVTNPIIASNFNEHGIAETSFANIPLEKGQYSLKYSAKPSGEVSGPLPAPLELYAVFGGVTKNVDGFEVKTPIVFVGKDLQETQSQYNDLSQKIRYDLGTSVAELEQGIHKTEAAGVAIKEYDAAIPQTQTVEI